MSAVTLSIVIVEYNTPDDLRRCLGALHASPAPFTHEVIVIDNSIPVKSAPAVPQAMTAVRYLAMAENLWFCGGNIHGLARASGEYALLLNPDTIPNADALEAMVVFMQRHPEYAGCTVQLRYPDGRIQRTCSRIPTYLYLLLNHTPLGWLLAGWKARVNARHWMADWSRERDCDIEVLPGSCLLMRRTDLVLDGELKLYFPEDDLGQRFRGKPFRFLAGVHITHAEKSSTRTWRAAQLYFSDMLIYTRKHHGRGAAWLLWLGSRPVYVGMWAAARLRQMLR